MIYAYKDWFFSKALVRDVQLGCRRNRAAGFSDTRRPKDVLKVSIMEFSNVEEEFINKDEIKCINFGVLINIQTFSGLVSIP